jgi:hypothetical protein
VISLGHGYGKVVDSIITLRCGSVEPERWPTALNHSVSLKVLPCEVFSRRLCRDSRRLAMILLAAVLLTCMVWGCAIFNHFHHELECGLVYLNSGYRSTDVINLFTAVLTTERLCMRHEVPVNICRFVVEHVRVCGRCFEVNMADPVSSSIGKYRLLRICNYHDLI